MKARKKPVEIEFLTFDEAVKQRTYYNGLSWQNQERANGTYIQKYHLENDYIVINTLNGPVKMTDKDYLIIGVQDELYPCDIDIFNETYDILEVE
jgi:hypothetical protein